MPDQDHEHSEYLSYLLRLWHTQSGGASVWRAGLEDPLTQEVLRFENLAGLFAFLRSQTGEGATEGSTTTTPSQDDEGSTST
jgi:hypothetical protein